MWCELRHSFGIEQRGFVVKLNDLNVSKFSYFNRVARLFALVIIEITCVFPIRNSPGLNGNSKLLDWTVGEITDWKEIISNDEDEKLKWPILAC